MPDSNETPAATTPEAPKSPPSNAHGRVDVRADDDIATVTYSPPAGPLAGQTLRGGRPETHPQHGPVVVFLRDGNDAAFKAAGVPAREFKLTVRAGDKPELAELRSAVEGHMARRSARIDAELAAGKERDARLVREMHEEAGRIAAEKVPADHALLEPRFEGNDFGRVRWYADGEPVPNLPGIVVHGKPQVAGRYGTVGYHPVASIPRAELAKFRAEAAAQKAGVDSRVAARQAEKDAALASALALARSTGKPALVGTRTEVDDSGAHAVSTYVRPDGTTYSSDSPAE